MHCRCIEPVASVRTGYSCNTIPRSPRFTLILILGAISYQSRHGFNSTETKGLLYRMKGESVPTAQCRGYRNPFAGLNQQTGTQLNGMYRSRALLLDV